MGEDETRIFEIDKRKPDCAFEGTEINIRKTAMSNPQTKVVYRVYLKVVGHEDDAYIDCMPGFVDQLRVQGSLEGCGVGKMLMKLCLNEKNIHNVQNNEDTKVMRDIKKSVLELSEENEEKLSKLDKWASSVCSKLVYLIMVARRESGKAHVHFNSALESGYSLMGIVT